MAKKFNRAIPILFIAACVGLAPRVSSAAQLQVCKSGCAYSTIQAAVNAAASGDMIFVGPGIYSERVTIQGKALNIEGSPATIVQGVGVGGPVFTLGAGSSPYYEVDLSYLTVMGGDHNAGSEIGGGIQVRVGAYLHLSNVVVTNNYAGSGGGVGVMTSGGPATTLSQCSISNNTGGVGGGLYVSAGASVSVEQCSLSNNTADYGGGIYTEAESTLTMAGSTVSGNQAIGRSTHFGPDEGAGGGLYVLGNLAISSSTISGNSATNGNGRGTGAGLYVLLDGKVSIQGSVIAENTIIAGSGAGIFAASSNPSATLILDEDYIVFNTVQAIIDSPPAGGVANEGTLVLSGGTSIANNTSPNCAGGTGCPP